MGWSDEQRTAHLHRVVCQPLPHPSRRCRHLASHVLGRVLRRVEADFEARYRYRPWLVETFVAPAHEGASFRAANFVCVGPTRDVGAATAPMTVPAQSVYLYELATHWRRTLGVARVEAAPSLGPGEGLDSTQWALQTSLEAPRWETSGRHGWCEAPQCSHRVRAMRSPAPRTARR